MIDFLVKLMILSVLTGIFVMPIVLLISRLVFSLVKKLSLKELLLITLIPFSLGFELYFPPNSKLKKIYHILLIITFTLLVFGSLFQIYTFKTI